MTESTPLSPTERLWLEHQFAAPGAVERTVAFDPAAYERESLLQWMANGRSPGTWCKAVGAPRDIAHRRRMVAQWVADDPDFAALYDASADVGVDSLLEDVLAIVDDDSRDAIETVGPKGDVRRVPNPVAVQRARLRVDARFRLAETLVPGRFARMQRVAIGGDPAAPPVQISDHARHERLRLLVLQALARRETQLQVTDGQSTDSK